MPNTFVLPLRLLQYVAIELLSQSASAAGCAHLYTLGTVHFKGCQVIPFLWVRSNRFKMFILILKIRNCKIKCKSFVKYHIIYSTFVKITFLAHLCWKLRWSFVWRPSIRLSFRKHFTFSTSSTDDNVLFHLIFFVLYILWENKIPPKVTH